MYAEPQQLKKIIKEEIGIDIHSKKRYRGNVDAKKIFSYIMYKRGMSKSQIAREIGVRHCTVIHYLKTIDSLMKYDPSFSYNYNLCNESFINLKLKSLSLETDRLIKLKSGDTDLIPIINFLRSTIKRGTEDQVKPIIKRAVDEFYANDIRHN